MTATSHQPSARTESAERLARPLIRLAKASGVATSYIDQLGDYVEIADDVLVDVLAALGVDASSPEAIARSQAALDERDAHRVLPSKTIVVTVAEGSPAPKGAADTGATGTAASAAKPETARRLTPAVIRLHCPEGAEPSVTLTLEDGSTLRNEQSDLLPDLNSADWLLTLPADLPIGYHTLRVTLSGDVDDVNTATATATADGEATGESATLIVAPKRIPLPKPIAEHPRWGWMTQLYSVRSRGSWGVGDYGDLKRLLADAGERSGADFMLINPVHACAPVPPLEPSPYLPESRRFLNATYIRPQDIPEYAAAADRTAGTTGAGAGSAGERQDTELMDARAVARVQELHALVAYRNDDAKPMDLNEAWRAKRQALRLIFEAPRSPEREAAFEEFKRQAGPDLDAFATWCVAFEVWGAPWEEPSWFHTTNRDSPEVRKLVEEHRDLFEFNRWLQWIADEQLTAAQRAAKASGMALGLMMDMAVGVHSLGADAWWYPERFAADGVTVGCPPDFYNQQGQDWGQPPFHPRYLEETGYRVYREMVHAMFAHAGAVRIDHILGLFRLWWIPRGKGAKGGAYVTYDHEAMLAVLAIEATRANGVVVGEDLGTVPDYVHEVLSSHGVFGTDVAWFSRVDDSPNAGDPYKPPTDYRRQTLASVTTHDLPPTAGYLEFEHVKLRERLHLLDGPVSGFAALARAERRAMLDMLVEGGWLPAADAAAAERDMPAYEQEIVEAMHAMLTETPSLLRQAALVDGTGQHASVNQPGTSDQYPNWRIPLQDAEGRVVHTDEVFKDPRVLSLAEVMSGK
ncbi:4-alpha-glucanotransferase [Bifidobacterium saguinibicoloris]|uniref:4-alpha-glucanotransferase n=1 Tax=Bifidobacterium saguinibicoloris TaxID=2834433 RepID=UPI001C5831E9|nr:4-alpha-glucanotransferase [Bifidobacterium saguinibicoloris]MBW3081310.1 4-alpha-glucanotransferase [Bifidobacterium saguinibicoloris]